MLPKRPSAFGLAGMTFFLIWLVITVLALVWGVEINMCDDYHVQYGFPMIWAVHQLVTIAGPCDIWYVDFSVLLINVTFWLGSMAVGVIALRYITRAKKNQVIRSNPSGSHARFLGDKHRNSGRNEPDCSCGSNPALTLSFVAREKH